MIASRARDTCIGNPLFSRRMALVPPIVETADRFHFFARRLRPFLALISKGIGANVGPLKGRPTY